MAKRIPGAVLLLVVATAALAQHRLTTAELVAKLGSQGERVVYSNDLLDPRRELEVPDISLDGMRTALRELGLALREQDGVWVVVREAPTPGASAAGPGESPVQLETVIVTGTLHRFPGGDVAPSRHSFGARELATLPALASDAMRATLRLPGVSSVGISAKPQIRGGLEDELLVMQDGVELLEPFHLADYHSAYSSFDYHTIESLDLYAGGFPSRYGNRISGVIDVRNEWREADYRTDIGVSTFSNFLHTRGDLPTQRAGGWLLSLRSGDLSDLADYIETRSGDPEYLDAALRVNAGLSDAWDLTAGVVYAEDDIVFEDEEERASSQVDTRYAWLSLDWRPAAGIGSRFTVSWLDFDREKRQLSFEVPDDGETVDEDKGGFLDYRQHVERVALRNDWRVLRDTSLYEFGWQLEYNKADYRNNSRIDRGDLADVLGTPGELEYRLRESPDGLSAGAYVQAEWDITPRLAIQPSLRWDAQDYYLQRDAEHQLSPRIGLLYEPRDELLMRLSVGRFHQPEGVHELQAIDGVDRFFAPQYADQLVAGLEWQRQALRLKLEAYYKHYDDQKTRYENMFNPFVLLPEMEPDRVAIAPRSALARGVDVQLGAELGEDWRAWLHYSYMDARDRLQGGWVDRRWSQRNTVNSGVVWQRGPLTLSLAATWHSGWRSALMPEFVAEGEVVPVESVLNNTELRDYFSLDLGLRYQWTFSRSRLEVYADISNLTDRKNEAGIDYDVEEVEGGYALEQDFEVLLGRVPSVGLTLSF